MPLQLDRMAELDTALAAGALLLAPNYRSSDQLVDQLCLHRQRVHGGKVFTRPAIRAIDLWANELWTQLATVHSADILHSRILQPVEEKLLWQQLIQSSSPELLLLNRDGTADAASEAWRLLQQWQIPLTELRKHLSIGGAPEHRDDREYAWTWLQAFDQTCRRQRLLSVSAMLQHLLQFVEDGTLASHGLLPRALLLAGFDAPPPLYRSLFAALRAQGLAVHDWSFATCAPEQSLVSCAEPADECRAAASWAQAVLRKDPQARIGIISADSQVLKGELERSCAQIFTATPHLFSTTLPAGLSDAPYVHAALASLALLQDELDTLQCCALLRSPWLLAADAEQDARAELELRLRRPQALRVRTAELRELCAQNDAPWHCPALGNSLLTLQQGLLRQPRHQALQAWLQFFIECWNTLLPRAVLLRSGERTLVKAWEALIKQAQLSSSLFGKLDFSEAVALLKRMTRSSTLGAENTQAPVQLLTPVMAASLHFTHVWCMQMTEALWPGEQQAHPYLPLNLQREHGLLGSDRDQQLQESRDTLQNLVRRTACELVFSHATSSEDLPQRRTALLPANLQARAVSTVNLPGALHPAVAELGSTALEVLQDSTVVPTQQAVPVQGGSGILTHQSACPFRAFAQYRLQARELLPPVYGLPSHAIGDCVHEALQAFWQSMQSHAALLATESATLDQALQQALEPALRRLARLYPTVLTPTLQALEVSRLHALLLRWLEVERARGPFTVFATEQELLWSLPRLQLRLRLDRIDRHTDGSTVIVDYKTGRGTTNRWEDARPAAPQLLLYQLAVDADTTRPQTSALLYARINVEEPGYDGIARDDAVYPGLAFTAQKYVTHTDWDALKQYWQRVVGMLADEFLQGYAAVQPARSDSCNYCHLGSLCRIGELRGTPEPQEDEA